MTVVEAIVESGYQQLREIKVHKSKIVSSLSGVVLPVVVGHYLYSWFRNPRLCLLIRGVRGYRDSGYERRKNVPLPLTNGVGNLTTTVVPSTSVTLD